MTVFVGAGWELPLLIVLEAFIWLAGCWGLPPPGPLAGFPEARCWPFWLDKPRMTWFSVLAVLIVLFHNVKFNSKVLTKEYTCSQEYARICTICCPTPCNSKGGGKKKITTEGKRGESLQITSGSSFFQCFFFLLKIQNKIHSVKGSVMQQAERKMARMSKSTFSKV